MKRRLILMRHASASGAGTGTDRARSLTQEGIREAREMGLRSRRLGFVPDRVLSSSAIRCQQTWEAFRIGLQASAAARFDDALYNASASGLRHGLALIDDAETLLLIAHNPGISMLALELGSGQLQNEETLPPIFAPATLAVFEIDATWPDLSRRTTRLLRLLRPTSAA